MATPKQTDPQFKLRLTPELRDAIENAANGNNRSMNAEIVHRLERSFLVNISDLMDPADRLQRLATMISEIAEGLNSAREEKMLKLQAEFIARNMPPDHLKTED
ncbi:Arc family DNA-binding protein [Ferirhizobium litorale]|uniref:Arc family DNA-binding protein n=1 Tax=Ferirhizobium litorale TaxID=2927786 RepID=A0AAE3QDW3_9HYPH|nr:Arc family DNA-binding protein [Fererhizobium litorale]MDI7921755.1 Arc family DNA-binding protein [Fererhizobium litorale]